jgi:hypothetical protein
LIPEAASTILIINHLSIIYTYNPPLGFAEGSEGNSFPVDSPVLVDLPMGK